MQKRLGRVVTTLPVVRVERLDGSHEHPDIQKLRTENDGLRKALRAIVAGAGISECTRADMVNIAAVALKE